MPNFLSLKKMLIPFIIISSIFSIQGYIRQPQVQIKAWKNFKVTLKTKLKISQKIPIYERQQIRESSKEEALRQASIFLEDMKFNSNFSLAELLSRNATFARKYSLFMEDLNIHSLFFRRHFIEIVMQIPLRGSKGLISQLPINWNSQIYQGLMPTEYIGEGYLRSTVKSEFLSKLARVKYTGLIVNLTEFKVEKSFCPRIYSQSGRLIYGPEFLHSSTGKQRGVLSYVKSMQEFETKNRAGNNPLFTVALTTTGRYQTDAVISKEDTEKLFQHPDTLRNLKKARVVFLLK